MIILVLGLAALAAAAGIEPYLVRTRPGADQDYALAAPQNASPLVVFTTVALGGFRGIAVDILWARVSLLQEEGEYVEIAQLSDWITKLNPRLPVVWDYHSHNIAYNIAAMVSSPQDRWRWISAGIRMLRDEAIAYNPHSADLYDRLCRIYKHKMVDYADPGRHYYRVAWAEEMSGTPAGQAQDAGTLAAMSGRPAGFLDEHKLDPVFMAEVDRIYGPLDWRLPEAHVIYWASRGMKDARGRIALSLDVMICEAESESLMNGRIADFRPADGILTTDVRDDLLPKAIAAFEATAARNGLALLDDSGFGRFYRSFLRRAVVALVARDRRETAETVFKILREKLHDRGTDRPMDEYVAALKAPSSPTDARPVDIP